MDVSYRWSPIEDLPSDHKHLVSPELKALFEVWGEQKESLQRSEMLRQFNERLRREWAIEAGVVERVYSLDRGITLLLIEKGIDASLIPQSATDRDPELVARIIRDHEEAIEGIFDAVGSGRELSTGFIKGLHALITRSQETTSAINTLGHQREVRLLRGTYKTLPNNPLRPDGTLHEYCPPEHVASEMERLLALHAEHRASAIPPEVEAAWFHRRFAQIHPFQDGNGRLARLLASLLLIKAGWFPLVITRDERERYIDALETADRGDLRPFVQLITTLERKEFVKALGVARDVLREERVDQVIAAARDLLESRRQILRRERDRAKSIAASLQSRALQVFQDTVKKLHDELSRYSPSYKFWADSEAHEGKRHHFFRWQVIQTAKKLDYFADTTEYSAWVRLVLTTETQAEIVLAFHSIGHEFRGILAASMCFFRREETEGGGREIADLTLASDEVFQINYRENQAQVTTRFEEWLQRGLVKALETWRRGL